MQASTGARARNPGGDMTMNLLMGLIFHTDVERARNQAGQAEVLADGLSREGISVEIVKSSFQSDWEARSSGVWADVLAVLQHSWAQEIHHLREVRRRRNSPLRISWNKKRKALWRVVKLAFSSAERLRALRRFDIEAALTRKHQHLWEVLANSESDGMVILEDDFSLRDQSSSVEVAKLLARYSGSVDYIDLAGGFTRTELGFRSEYEGDLVLEYMVANTTCAYYLSKLGAEALLSMLTTDREKEYLSPDFAVTSLNDTGFKGKTVLPASLPLVHGTREGGMTSSIPY